MSDKPKKAKRFALSPDRTSFTLRDLDNVRLVIPPPRFIHIPHPRLAPPGMAGIARSARPTLHPEGERPATPPPSLPRSQPIRVQSINYLGLARSNLSVRQPTGAFAPSAQAPAPRAWDPRKAKFRVVFIPHVRRAPPRLEGERLKKWIEAQPGRPTEVALKVFKPFAHARGKDRDIDR